MNEPKMSIAIGADSAEFEPKESEQAPLLALVGEAWVVGGSKTITSRR